MKKWKVPSVRTDNLFQQFYECWCMIVYQKFRHIVTLHIQNNHNFIIILIFFKVYNNSFIKFHT